MLLDRLTPAGAFAGPERQLLTVPDGPPHGT